MRADTHTCPFPISLCGIDAHLHPSWPFNSSKQSVLGLTWAVRYYNLRIATTLRYTHTHTHAKTESNDYSQSNLEHQIFDKIPTLFFVLLNLNESSHLLATLFEIIHCRCCTQHKNDRQVKCISRSAQYGLEIRRTLLNLCTAMKTEVRKWCFLLHSCSTDRTNIFAVIYTLCAYILNAGICVCIMTTRHIQCSSQHIL